MKRFGYILSLIPAIMIAGNSFSQQVIATAGGSGTGTGIQLSWTIGEPITSTTHGSDFYLTQGFHQSQPITALVNQELSLSEGWNIISTRVIPENKDMMDVFQSLISTGHLKKVMSEEGKTLEDWGVYGGWKNGIGNLTSTEGYNVNVKTPTILRVEGSTFIFPFYIQLTTGWNIISWPSPNPQDGMEAFNTLITEGKLKKVMDESGGTIEDWGVYGGWTNNIGNLKPGEGYKVNVTGDCTLIINESGTKSEVVVPQTLVSNHFVPAFRGNGTEHMNINLVNLAESGINPGDEIGVFDGNVCVGSSKIVNQLPIAIGTLIVNQNFVSIPVSANDGLAGKNGFTVGNNIEMRLYRNGAEYSVTLQPLSSSGAIFKKGSSLFAQLDLTTGIAEIPGSGFTEINCYPNPFSEVVNIEIVLASKQNIDVKVYDAKGALVRSLFESEAEGKLNVYWNGRNQAGAKMNSGTYFIKINDSTFKVLLE